MFAGSRSHGFVVRPGHILYRRLWRWWEIAVKVIRAFGIFRARGSGSTLRDLSHPQPMWYKYSLLLSSGVSFGSRSRGYHRYHQHDAVFDKYHPALIGQIAESEQDS